MEKLTENNIKHATLSFLKGYYRFRPRTGDTEATIDMRGKGGIIADGFLSFPLEDGSSFLATFEATSYSSKEEVVYKVQRGRLLWDSLALAFLCTAAWFAYTYSKHINTVKDLGIWMTIGLLWLMILGIVLAYQLLFSWLRRYRYIYAVEQFKKYHADEQWVSIGEDIFNDSENRYLKELRNQCIYNGFGLIIVDKNGQPQLSITPSRKELFASKRSMIQFFDLQDLTKRIGDNTYLDNLKVVQDQGLKLLGNTDFESLERFRKTYQSQMILCGISLAIISGIFYKELNDPVMIYMDQEVYEEEILKPRLTKQTRESNSYLLDSVAIRSFDKDAEPYLDVAPKTGPNPYEKEETPAGIIIFSKGKQAVSYDCERFYNFKKKKYLIEFGKFSSLEAAAKQVKELDKIDLEAHCLWMGCFSDVNFDYIVFINLWYNSKWEARADARDLELKLEEENLERTLSVRTIEPFDTEEF